MDIRAQIEARIEAEKAKRAAAGLFVEWIIPHPQGGTRPFSAYASSEAVRQKWIADGERKGWKLVVR